jgi:hypothetical protein
MAVKKRKSYAHRTRNKTARFKAKHKAKAKRLIRQHNS